MHIFRSLTFKAVLIMSILLFICSGSTAFAQPPSNSIVHLPAFLNGAFAGFDLPPADPEFEQIVSAPLAAVSDHLRDSSYASSLTFFNPYSAAVTITSKSYDNDGSPYSGSATYFISAFSTLTLFPLEQGVNGVTFFPEMTAVNPITAIYSSFKNLDDSYFTYIATSPSTQVYLPLLCKCDYETVIGIENTNDVDAIVTIEYSDGESTVANIPAHTHRLIYQFFEEHGAEPFSGSLSSSVPVMASVLQTDLSASRGYAGIEASSADLIFPFVNFGAATTTFANIQIQNAGSESTEIGVTYRPTSGEAVCTQSQVIEAGASATFAGSAFNDAGDADCVFGDGFIGSARVTTNSTEQPLAGVAELFQNSVGIGSYGGIREESTTEKVAFPLVVQSSEESPLESTRMHVVNAGPTASNVTCFFPEPGNERIESALIPAAGMAIVTLSVQMSELYNGAATCISDGNGKLAAIVNIKSVGNLDTEVEVRFATYRGINF